MKYLKITILISVFLLLCFAPYIIDFFKPVEKQKGEMLGYTIGIGATSTLVSTGYSAVTSYSWSHTTESGSTLLVLTASIWLDVAPNGNISTLTYGGNAMTKASSTRGGTMSTEIWYLVNPPSGSNLVAITLSGATDGRKFMAVALSNTATSPLNVISSSIGYGTSASTNITTTSAGEYIFDVITSYGGTVPTNSQTTLYKDTTSSINSGSSYYNKATAGTQAMAWSWTTAGDWSHLAASFKAKPDPTGTPKIFNKNVILKKNVIIK
jgi:hypothetical protein